MQVLKTHNSKELLIIEVPEHILSFSLREYADNTDSMTENGKGCYLHCKYDENHISINLSLNESINKFKIIGLLKDLSDKDVEFYVESYSQTIGWRLDEDESKLPKNILYCNYLVKKPIPITFLFSSAKESFISLLQSHNIDTNNLNTILLLQKL